MKSKTLGQAMAVLMGLACTLPATSAPKSGDFVINCKLFMKNSSGTALYVRSTATSTQSGGLYLTSTSSSATIFAFIRRSDTYTEDSNGTQYTVVPRGNCMGFINGTGATHRAAVQVDDCDSVSKRTWIVDNRPTTANPNAFVMRLNFSPTKFLNADTIANGTQLIVYDQPITSVFDTQRFYTSGCRHADYTNAKPRGGI